MNTRSTLRTIALIAATVAVGACGGDGLRQTSPALDGPSPLPGIVEEATTPSVAASEGFDAAPENLDEQEGGSAAESLDSSGAENAAQEVTSSGVSATGGNDLLPLSERADRAGVSLAIAEAWETRGVFISNTGFVWAETCAAARGVVLPAGIRIAC